MCRRIPRYPSMIKMLECCAHIAHREGISRCESFSANRDSHDGYLWTAVWMKILAVIRLIDPRASPLFHFRAKEMGAIFSEARKIRRKSPFTIPSSVPLREWNRTWRKSVASSPIEQRASLLLEWRGLEAALSSKPRGEKERNDKKRRWRRRGRKERREKKERGKEKKGLRRDYFPEEKGGNSKAAGISSAFAWKYRSSQRIDRIFRDREIFQSTPPSPFLTFTLHYLSIVSPSASNHHRGN